ncbi:MAG: type Z 30S ribosomal protein S14 [Clostridium sp.]
MQDFKEDQTAFHKFSLEYNFAESGRPYAYLRKYGICRICFRERFEGFIPVLRRQACKL